MEKNKVARDQGEQPVEQGGNQIMLRRARVKGGLTRAQGPRYKRIPSLSGSLRWLPGVSVHHDAPPSWVAVPKWPLCLHHTPQFSVPLTYIFTPRHPVILLGSC